MKTKIILALMLLIAGNLLAQKTVEKRTWKGGGSHGAYVVKNGELIPIEEANLTPVEAPAKVEATAIDRPAAPAETADTADMEPLKVGSAVLLTEDINIDTRPGSYRMAKDFYEWAGKCHLSFISAGYTFDMADNITPDGLANPMKHVVDVSVLDWRVRCFGMSLLNFEMEMGSMYPDHIEHRAIYKPTINFYIPVCKAMAFKIYGGAEADMSYVYKINKDYDYDYDRDFFFNVDAGLGVQVVPHGVVPIEINCEYRYPIQSLTKAQDRLTQGFYLTARFFLGMPF